VFNKLINQPTWTGVPGREPLVKAKGIVNVVDVAPADAKVALHLGWCEGHPVSHQAGRACCTTHKHSHISQECARGTTSTASVQRQQQHIIIKFKTSLRLGQ